MLTQAFAHKTVYTRAGVVSMSNEATKNFTASSNPEHALIKSRFGVISLRLDQAVFFPQGLLGLPKNLHFGIADIPTRNMGNFKLLQCLNDHALSFVVLPLDIDNPLIARDDLIEACKTLNIKTEDLLTLVILSVQRSPEGIRITGNLRAPVMIDVRDRAGIQHVFPHNKYQICEPLSA